MSVHYHEGKFPPQSLDWERMANPIAHAASAVGRYDSFLRVIPNPDVLIAPMLVQEAVTSSRIEGTHATMGDVLRYEADGGDFSPTEHDDVLEVDNYRYALSKAEEMMGSLPLCGRVIRSAHEILLSNVRGSAKQPGRYRTEQNWIGTSNDIDAARYVPIAPSKLQDAMARWEHYVNDDSITVLVRVAVAHAEFESIHPFLDGNGRIGRMIVPLMMYADGAIGRPCFYLSEFFEHRNGEYQDKLLAVSASDAWTEWVVFFLEAIEVQAKENYAKAQRIHSLYQRVQHEVAAISRASGADKAVDCLFHQAIFPANTLQKKAGMKPNAANKLLTGLKESGRLLEVRPSRGRRPATLAFPDLITAVEGSMNSN